MLYPDAAGFFDERQRHKEDNLSQHVRHKTTVNGRERRSPPEAIKKAALLMGSPAKAAPASKASTEDTKKEEPRKPTDSLSGLQLKSHFGDFFGGSRHQLFRGPACHDCYSQTLEVAALAGPKRVFLKGRS